MLYAPKIKHTNIYAEIEARARMFEETFRTESLTRARAEEISKVKVLSDVFPNPSSLNNILRVKINEVKRYKIEDLTIEVYSGENDKGLFVGTLGQKNIKDNEIIIPNDFVKNRGCYYLLCRYKFKCLGETVENTEAIKFIVQ